MTVSYSYLPHKTNIVVWTDFNLKLLPLHRPSRTFESCESLSLILSIIIKGKGSKERSLWENCLGVLVPLSIVMNGCLITALNYISTYILITVSCINHIVSILNGTLQVYMKICPSSYVWSWA